MNPFSSPSSSSESSAASSAPLVAVIMGSKSDWACMQHVTNTLTLLNIPYEARVVSAHRTPDLLFEYVSQLEERKIKVLIAGAGGAAHLPGMAASKTLIPVIGVPILSNALRGLDSLLSIVQMPAGVPVATVAIGDAGAKNAALLAAQILGSEYPEIRRALGLYRDQQTEQVLQQSLLLEIPTSTP